MPARRTLKLGRKELDYALRDLLGLSGLTRISAPNRSKMMR